MKARAAACLTAILIVSAASAAHSSIKRATLSCAPGSADVICRVTASLNVTPAPPGIVTSNAPRAIAAKKFAATSPGGSADLFLMMQADCRMARPTAAGTVLRTRYPDAYLFSQTRGKTLCTLAGNIPARVLGAGRLPAALPVRAFYADVRNEGKSPAQARLISTPRSSLMIAAFKGTLLVTLSTGKRFELVEGKELVVVLGPRNDVKASTRPAQFMGADRRAFAIQRKELR
jgi:hypothetical protein